MRDYQLAGLNWLIRLYENGINGILADEMVRWKCGLCVIPVVLYVVFCSRPHGTVYIDLFPNLSFGFIFVIL